MFPVFTTPHPTGLWCSLEQPKPTKTSEILKNDRNKNKITRAKQRRGLGGVWKAGVEEPLGDGKRGPELPGSQGESRCAQLRGRCVWPGGSVAGSGEAEESRRGRLWPSVLVIGQLTRRAEL